MGCLTIHRAFQIKKIAIIQGIPLIIIFKQECELWVIHGGGAFQYLLKVSRKSQSVPECLQRKPEYPEKTINLYKYIEIRFILDSVLLMLLVSIATDHHTYWYWQRKPFGGVIQQSIHYDCGQCKTLLVKVKENVSASA